VSVWLRKPRRATRSSFTHHATSARISRPRATSCLAVLVAGEVLLERLLGGERLVESADGFPRAVRPPADLGHLERAEPLERLAVRGGVLVGVTSSTARSRRRR
jgi:hypothetical protein